jgi:hypothetical protein
VSTARVLAIAALPASVLAIVPLPLLAASIHEPMHITVPAATYQQTATACITYYDCMNYSKLDRGSLDRAVSGTSGPFTGSGAVKGAIFPGGGPYLMARSVAKGAGAALVSSLMFYYFQVIGPASVQVPIIGTFTGTYAVKAGPLGTASSVGRAIFAINPASGNNTPYYVNGGCMTASGPACAPLNTQVPFSVMSSTSRAIVAPTMVELLVNPDAETSPPAEPGENGTAKASATINANFVIDPSWPNASQYKIKFSKGVRQK